LARNAPALGGTIGAIAAAPANLLDAVTGAGGTAIDVAAAGAGQSIGQEIKNKVMGDKTSTLKEGLIGGATQLAGIKAGQYLVKGAKAVKGALSSNIAKTAEDKAVQQGYDQFTKVKPQVLQNNDLNGTMDKLGELNLPKNTEGMHTYHDTVTGDNGVASGTMRQILSNTPPVDVGTVIDDSVLKSVRSHGIGDTAKRGSQANQLVGDIRDTVNNQLFPEGTLSQKADPNKVFDLIQYAGSMKSKFATADPGTFAAAQHDAWTTVKNNLEDKLYNDGGVSKAVKDFKFAPEDEAAIRKTVQDKGGSPELAEHIISGVNGASRGQDMRALQYGAVKAGNLANEADKVASGALPKGTPEDIQGLGPADAMKLAAHAHSGGLTAIPELALHGAKALAGGGEKLAVKGIDAAGKVASSKPAMVAGTALPQLAVQGTAGASPSDSGQIAAGTGPVSSMVSSQASQLMGSLQKQSQGPPPIQEITPQQEQEILRTSGVDGLRAVLDTQSTNLAIQKQEYPEITGDQQTQIKDITKALQGTVNAATLYEQAAGLGAGTGALAELGTKIPGIQNLKSEAALKTYMDNRAELASNIANVIGTGRSSSAMINQLKSELPSPTDSAKTAQAKFSYVISMLNDAMKNTMAMPASNTPGQLTNFSGQSVPGLTQAEPQNLSLMNFIGAK
jgi:hypothetical protein